MVDAHTVGGCGSPGNAVRPSIGGYLPYSTGGSPPQFFRHARTCFIAVRFNSGGRSARLKNERVSDSSRESGHEFRRAGIARRRHRCRPGFPSRHPPPSWPDSFRPSTSHRIAVRARRERGGGPTWMPGTSPGMTTKGGCRRTPAPAARAPRRYEGRPEVKPDSNETSPGITTGGGTTASSGYAVGSGGREMSKRRLSRSSIRSKQEP